ncbi:MAG: hypothetical protein AAB403_03720 [Planctomycetota bacterium]
MALYTIYNGPMPTTASLAAVTTGTAIKTLLQIKPFNVCKIVEWGISFDGSAAATPIEVELLDTGTVFATVTASADADVMKMDGAEGAVASVAGLTLGTAATGYTASAEGTITVTKLFDTQLIAPTNQYVKQFPLGREPKCIIGNSVRIRVKAGAAVNAIAYMVIEI